MVKQKGFSLIEALIALLVLTIGLIGMAGMQTRAFVNAQQSYLESVATLAAVDAQERLWKELANKNCTQIEDDIGDLEAGWVTDWFERSDSPLKNFSGSFDVADKEVKDCTFTVEINLRSGDQKFFIRLPDL